MSTIINSFITHFLSLRMIGKRIKHNFITYSFIMHLFSFHVIRNNFWHFWIYHYYSNASFWRRIVTCTIFSINYVIYTNTKKLKELSCIGWNLKQCFYSFTKKLFWIVIKIFFIIKSNNQELIHHINCFGYKFCLESNQSNHKFLLYDLYFESYSWNLSNIYYSRKKFYIHYGLFCNNSSIHALLFFRLNFLWL